MKLFQSDESAISALKQSSNYSPIFGVVLPKITELPLTVETDAKRASLQFQKSYDPISVPSGHSQRIQSKLNEYLKREQDAMEERIRQFIEAETKAYDELKEKVNQQREAVMK